MEFKRVKNASPLNHKYGKIYTENQKEVVKKFESGSYDLISGYGWDFVIPFLNFCNMLGTFKLFSEVEAKGYKRQMFPSENKQTKITLKSKEARINYILTS